MEATRPRIVVGQTYRFADDTPWGGCYLRLLDLAENLRLRCEIVSEEGTLLPSVVGVADLVAAIDQGWLVGA